MTPDFTPNDEMSSPADFEAALGQLLLVAHRNDVDPRGTWEYRTEATNADVEVMVVELAN